MNRLALIALLALLCSTPAYADDEASSNNKESQDTTTETALTVTGGCVGGALIGSAVPIFGNLLGCAIGGFASWWVSTD